MARFSISFRAICLAFVFVGMLAGCGDSGDLPTYKTTGTVAFEDGKPVAEGTMMLIAEGLPPGRAIIQDGQFAVTTYQPNDGAVEGTHRVTVTVNPPLDYDPDSGRPPITAKAKYQHPDSSGIAFEVTPDGENTFEVILERGR